MKLHTMGKRSQIYSEGQDSDASSSVESFMRRKRSFLSKHESGNLKKKKVKVLSEFDSEELNIKHRVKAHPQFRHKLRGILKHDRDRESASSAASEDEESYVSPIASDTHGRCLVGRVPRSAGSKPCQSGGLAFVIRKDVNRLQSDTSNTNAKRNFFSSRLSRKYSY